MVVIALFLKLEFTQWKAEQPLQGMELQEEHKKSEAYRKYHSNEPTLNGFC